MAWLGSDWGFRKKITIQNANIDSDLTDFPVYVPLKADEDIGDEARADGFDIRFTQSDGTTLLKYERESWTGGGGSDATADFWVKSNVTAATATEIYIYYGYPAGGDGEDATNVWDSDFEAVWHQNDSLLDSTGNLRNLTKSHAGITAQTGIVADGYEYNRAAGPEYTYRGYAINVPFTIEVWGNGTMGVGSQWVYTGDVSDANDFESIRETFPAVGGLEAISSNGVVAGTAATGNSTSDSTWFYAVGVFAAANSRSAYLDGDIANKGTDSTNVVMAGKDRVANGAFARAAPAGGFTGILDESRVSSIARPEAYIKFVHANISEGDNELTFGAEETEAANVTITPAAISLDLTIPGVTVVEGTGVTVTPAVIELNVTIGAVTVVGEVVISPDAIEININLPAPTIVAIARGIITLISEIDTSETFKSTIDTEVKFFSWLDSGD